MRYTRLILTLSGAAALAGCAALDTVTSDVSSYGDWPAGRAGGTYAFERLPSQQAHADQQAALETAARGALAQAGFQPAAEGAKADYTVQLGARITRNDRSPWDDPFWGRWGPPGYWRYPGWRYGGFYRPYDIGPYYEREVALLIRDAQTGRPLYETRASNDGNTLGGSAVLSAMYAAALRDFPTPAVNPRTVNVPMTSQPAQ